jgi:hypothetical protein
MEKRRLSIEITDEDQTRLRQLIPWGLMSRIMRILMLQTLDLVEVHGDIVLGALLSGKLTALDLIKKGDEGLAASRPETEHQPTV